MAEFAEFDDGNKDNKITEDFIFNTVQSFLYAHKHTGIDSSKISPSDLLGFPIFRSVPTHSAPEGTMLLYWDGMATYRIYVRMNKLWKFVNLT